MYWVLRGAVGVFVASTVATAAIADTKAGVDAYNAGDYARALKEWRPAALAGDTDAQFNLGQLYKLGRGVPVDQAQAMEWYKRAADHGHVKSQENYAVLMFQSGRRQEAIPYLERLAQVGRPIGQYFLGTAYFNGDGVGRDPVKGYAYMTLAAAQLLPQAQTALDQMNDRLPNADKERGLALAQQLDAAAKGNQIAQLDPRATGPAPIRTEPLPASTAPGVTYAPPAQVTKPLRAPKVKPTLPPKSEPAAGSIAPESAPDNVATSKPHHTMITPPPANSNGKGWRVQLGAYRDEAAAQSVGEDLLAAAPELSAYSFYIEKAHGVARLQLGPLASKAAAEHLCAQLHAKRAVCIIVRP